jgi:peptide/nickel transport system substrate-binding protein
MGTIKKFIALTLCLILLISGCDALFPYPYLPVTPSPLPSPSPIILPSPAPLAITFGIAFSPSETATFDPLTDTLRHNAHAARLCYEGLFELDERFVPRGVLCTELVTEDNIFFTARLRSEAVFHDGSPLTADDVVYSIRQAQRPGGLYSERLSAVSDVRAADGETVLITMNAPVFNAAALFDFPIIRESFDRVPPGTGPYRMVLEPDGGFLLPFDRWWQGKQHPADRIELVDASNAGSLVYSFQYGYISMTPFDPYDTLSPGIHSGYDKITVPSALMQYIGFNTARRPFDRYNARLAAALAIDRREAVREVYGEDAAAAVLPVPPSSPFYQMEAAMAYRFDISEAERLLAGISPLTEAVFIVAEENAARVRMAELLAQNLQGAGFAVRLLPLSRTAFNNALQNGDYDLYMTEARLAPNLDPAAFLSSKGAFAFGVNESAAMSEALTRLAAEDVYSSAGEDALRAVWDVLHDELPMLTICFRNTRLISQRGLISGQTPTFFDPFAGFADWTVHERG